MACSSAQSQEEPSIETDKLSYEIFSILETNFLFGYDDPDQKKPFVPKPVPDAPPQEPKPREDLPQNLHEVDAAVADRRGKICELPFSGRSTRKPSLLYQAYADAETERSEAPIFEREDKDHEGR
ncbi:hypothetical protein ACJRO7_026212 [Eucalyptus globulus]|uniref:Uncharacterized protein n=1 Tax=Eucalyptus globulus TaxID=34317 RepID=A0ABD3KEB2_EUCGL